MRKRIAIFWLGITLLMPIATAYASGNGDMFADQGNIIYNRPWVPGDAHLHHRDMFGDPNIYVQSGSDVFGHVRPPPDYGVEDLFSAHVRTIPDEPLYHWPKNKPYP